MWLYLSLLTSYLYRISSDSEEDELLRLVDDKSTPRATRGNADTRSGRLSKRRRSRSRSLTPPPALSFATVMHARNTVRYVPLRFVLHPPLTNYAQSYVGSRVSRPFPHLCCG